LRTNSCRLHVELISRRIAMVSKWLAWSSLKADGVLIPWLACALLVLSAPVALAGDLNKQPAADSPVARDNDASPAKEASAKGKTNSEKTNESTTENTSGSDMGSEKPASKTKAAHKETKRKGKGKGRTSKGRDITSALNVDDIAEPAADYHYAAFSKGDPFLPPMVLVESAEVTRARSADAAAGPMEIPIVSPLQRYDLRDLTLVGIWQLASGERKALVIVPVDERTNDPAQGIIIKVDDPIGNAGGKVLTIGKDFVTVREFSLGLDGAWKYKDRTMYFRDRKTETMARKIRFTPGKDGTTIVDDKGVDFKKLLQEEKSKSGAQGFGGGIGMGGTAPNFPGAGGMPGQTGPMGGMNSGAGAAGGGFGAPDAGSMGAPNPGMGGGAPGMPIPGMNGSNTGNGGSGAMPPGMPGSAMDMLKNMGGGGPNGGGSGSTSGGIQLPSGGWQGMGSGATMYTPPSLGKDGVPTGGTSLNPGGTTPQLPQGAINTGNKSFVPRLK